MTKQNSTLAYYEENAVAYAARDFAGTFEEYRDLFVSRVQARFQESLQLPNRKQTKPQVLELGSGSGRDAQAFLAHGFDVTLLDGSAELAEIAKKRTGLDVLVRDFEDLYFDAEFDGVWAAASLLHVPSDKLPGVLKTIARSLQDSGVFVASFKEGNHDWVDGLGRYFCAMTESHLTDFITNSGFELIAIDKRKGQGSDGKPTVWLWVIARKQIADI
ncbi:hypothetical protein WH96_05025 [Kiloniella spongiae]|uniref:Methyltransferase domain-containing protein n=1 Tax=Kiloniella spongiae TaxID=1489064 RepID=A0A0H2MGI1_9PROT|nr:class I SAM-dependent methyltransferase [Kiloniella spongiae]KLN61694.1 hypothetical protein WH96_05025 [Kiloniella spongiae]